MAEIVERHGHSGGALRQLLGVVDAKRLVIEGFLAALAALRALVPQLA